jgi:hypothetical protein
MFVKKKEKKGRKKQYLIFYQLLLEEVTVCFIEAWNMYCMAWLIGVRFVHGANICVFFTASRWSLGAPSLLSTGYGFSFPGVKRPGREVDGLLSPI